MVQPFSFVTQGGRPIAANKSYLKLFGEAASNGAINTSIIPPVDDLFDLTHEKIQQLRSDSAADQSELPRKPDPTDENTAMKTEIFSVRVSGLGHAKLWEITRKPDTDIWSPLFNEAPIGLMSMTPSGDIMALNAALEAWVGEELSRAKHVSDIFKDSDLLLMGEAESGRLDSIGRS